LIDLPIRIVPNSVIEHKDTPGVLYSSLEKHTGDIRVRNLITLLRLPA
jgi:hypothetical protein